MPATSERTNQGKLNIGLIIACATGAAGFVIIGSVVLLLALNWFILPYGYIDESGCPVINLDRWSVDECYGFQDGMAVTRALLHKRGTGWGWSYIDKHGKSLTNIESEELGHFSEGLAMVQVHKLCGYIDKQGKFVIAPQFAHANDFSDGLAGVEVGGKWGYISRRGTMVIQPKFDEVQQFSNGLAGVQLAGRVGYIDKTGRVVVPLIYDRVSPFSEGVGLGCFGNIKADVDRHTGIATSRSTVKQVYLDNNGKVLHNSVTSPSAILAVGYCKIENYTEPHGLRDVSNMSFSCGRALIQIGTKYGYMDRSFNIVIPANLDFGCRFSEGRALVYSKEKARFGYIDMEGKLVTGWRFKRASDFCNGLAAVTETSLANPFGFYGYVDKGGIYRIWPVFQNADPFSDGMAHVGACIESF
jgi:hypothetical protein